MILEASTGLLEKALAKLGRYHQNKAQNKITQPALLWRLVSLIDLENWGELDVDIRGEIYEGLL